MKIRIRFAFVLLVAIMLDLVIFCELTGASAPPMSQPEYSDLLINIVDQCGNPVNGAKIELWQSAKFRSHGSYIERSAVGGSAEYALFSNGGAYISTEHITSALEYYPNMNIPLLLLVTDNLILKNGQTISDLSPDVRIRFSDIDFENTEWRAYYSELYEKTEIILDIINRNYNSGYEHEYLLSLIADLGEDVEDAGMLYGIIYATPLDELNEIFGTQYTEEDLLRAKEELLTPAEDFVLEPDSNVSGSARRKIFSGITDQDGKYYIEKITSSFHVIQELIEETISSPEFIEPITVKQVSVPTGYRIINPEIQINPRETNEATIVVENEASSCTLKPVVSTEDKPTELEISVPNTGENQASVSAVRTGIIAFSIVMTFGRIIYLVYKYKTQS